MLRLLITLQMGLILLVGCGQSTYDERLENRISELKNSPPAAAENDAQDDGDEESDEATDEETTEEENTAEEPADEG
jgi:hypothetical protein